MTKQGLDAGGFLLLAEGHLRKARELIMEKDLSGMLGEVRWTVVDACNNTRRALKLLKEEEDTDVSTRYNKTNS